MARPRRTGARHWAVPCHGAWARGSYAICVASGNARLSAACGSPVGRSAAERRADRGLCEGEKDARRWAVPCHGAWQGTPANLGRSGGLKPCPRCAAGRLDPASRAEAVELAAARSRLPAALPSSRPPPCASALSDIRSDEATYCSSLKTHSNNSIKTVISSVTHFDSCILKASALMLPFIPQMFLTRLISALIF